MEEGLRACQELPVQAIACGSPGSLQNQARVIAVARRATGAGAEENVRTTGWQMVLGEEESDRVQDRLQLPAADGGKKKSNEQRALHG